MAISGTKDLTTGKPMKLVLGFAFPLLFGFLFQQLYNVVDTAIVGRFLGAEDLAAVGSTGSVNFLILGFCMGICSGFAIPVAQAFGAGDMSRMRRFVNNSVYLSVGISLVMGTVTALLCPQILRLMNTPAELMDGALAYIRVIFAAIPVMVVYNLAAGVLRSLGDSRTPVVFLVMASLINVVLDLAFILLLKMGVAGAAIATVISQLCACVGCVLVLVRKFPVLKSTPEEKRYDSRLMAILLGVGVPMGLQFSITALGSVALQMSVNGLGAHAVGGMTAGGKVCQFFMCIFDALATTMATFAGQNVGAKKLDRIQEGLIATGKIGTLYCLFATALIWLFGKSFLLIFLDPGEKEITELAYLYLKINSSMFIPLLLVNIVRLTIQGMGFTQVAMIAGALEMVARTFVAMAMVPPFGYTGACWANPAAWVAADLFLIPCYLHVMKKTRMKLSVDV